MRLSFTNEFVTHYMCLTYSPITKNETLIDEWVRDSLHVFDLFIYHQEWDSHWRMSSWLTTCVWLIPLLPRMRLSFTNEFVTHYMCLTYSPITKNETLIHEWVRDSLHVLDLFPYYQEWDSHWRMSSWLITCVWLIHLSPRMRLSLTNEFVTHYMCLTYSPITKNETLIPITENERKWVSERECVCAWEREIVCGRMCLLFVIGEIRETIYRERGGGRQWVTSRQRIIWCSVLQYAAGCCSVLQYVAVCCRVLHCVAVCRSVLQHVAACKTYNHRERGVYVLMCHDTQKDDPDAVCCSVLQCAAVFYSVLQHVAACCSMLQHVAACCSVLQCVAVCCNVLQCYVVCRALRCPPPSVLRCVLRCIATVCCSVS